MIISGKSFIPLHNDRPPSHWESSLVMMPVSSSCRCERWISWLWPVGIVTWRQCLFVPVLLCMKRVFFFSKVTLLSCWLPLTETKFGELARFLISGKMTAGSCITYTRCRIVLVSAASPHKGLIFPWDENLSPAVASRTGSFRQQRTKRARNNSMRRTACSLKLHGYRVCLRPQPRNSLSLSLSRFPLFV